MKEKSSSQTEAVWACLHGEMTDNQRSAFEQDLRDDAALCKTFDDAAQMDRLLRNTLPLIDQAEMSIDAVAEQALACWEREYDQEQASVPQYFSNKKKNAVRMDWHRLFFHPAAGMIGLAAAAIILLSTPVLLRSPEGLSWNDPVFTPLALRGSIAQEDRAGALSAGMASRCQVLLQEELARALVSRMDSKQTPPLVVSMHLQELRNGTFSLSVQVHTRKGEAVGSWSGDYSSEDAFKEQVVTSAARIADVLASWSDAVQGGERP